MLSANSILRPSSCSTCRAWTGRGLVTSSSRASSRRCRCPPSLRHSPDAPLTSAPSWGETLEEGAGDDLLQAHVPEAAERTVEGLQRAIAPVLENLPRRRRRGSDLTGGRPNAMGHGRDHPRTGSVQLCSGMDNAGVQGHDPMEYHVPRRPRDCRNRLLVRLRPSAK